MMYTIYVVFDDTVVPLRAVDLHSGHTLRSRRVEIKLVTHDDLFQAFFSRPITPGAPGQQPQPSSSPLAMSGMDAGGAGTGCEWVTEEAKERMLKLCSTGKNCFSAKTPERPFEHVQSYLALVPWDQPQVILSSTELGRLFDVACGVSTALLTFLNHDGFRDKFSSGLLRSLVQAGLSLPFNDERHQFLQSIYEANLKGAHEFLTSILQTRTIVAPISPTFVSTPPAAASGHGSLVGSSPSPPPQPSNSVNMYHAQQMQQFPHPLSQHVLMGTMGQYVSSPSGYLVVSSPSTPSALATEFGSYQEGFTKTMLPSRDSGVFDYAFGQYHESQQKSMNPYQDTSSSAGAAAAQGPAWAVISGYSSHLQRKQSTSPPLSSYETSPTSPSPAGPISQPPHPFRLVLPRLASTT
ncbi:hypothetical protein BCR44DRAFT_1015999 [Catenaria anguillulae PL171]|uniref:Uncharacterized protein n=1 Tax=Catenaria anguillulae PL171 TaxID=765915 RepID=A0A1Y2HTX5_9FUNG|nr:hypothetical protein BCR44DRAFT_1015999 [Catenaria anguillulae PL171]